jgi:hypothetical protein
MSYKKTGVMLSGALACILAGAGVEHVRQVLTTVPQEEPDPAEALMQAKKPAAPRMVVVKDEGSLRAAEALRRRVAELEQALAQRDAERVPEPPRPQEVQGDQPPPPQRRQSFSARMEQMKKDNPEQYAEMQKRREEFRQSVEQRAQDRADFLTSVETKNMDDAQKENHTKLLETVSRVNELMAQMSQPGVEHTPELHQQMGEAMASLGDLYGKERSFLLEETGRAVGYQGGQAAEFAAQVQAIIDNTTVPHRGHGGGGGQPIPPPQSPPVPPSRPQL